MLVRYARSFSYDLTMQWAASPKVRQYTSRPRTMWELSSDVAICASHQRFAAALASEQVLGALPVLLPRAGYSARMAFLGGMVDTPRTLLRLQLEKYAPKSGSPVMVWVGTWHQAVAAAIYVGGDCLDATWRPTTAWRGAILSSRVFGHLFVASGLIGPHKDEEVSQRTACC